MKETLIKIGNKIKSEDDFARLEQEIDTIEVLEWANCWNRQSPNLSDLVQVYLIIYLLLVSGAIYEMVKRRLFHEIIQDQHSVHLVTLCPPPASW